MKTTTAPFRCASGLPRTRLQPHDAAERALRRGRESASSSPPHRFAMSARPFLVLALSIVPAVVLPAASPEAEARAAAWLRAWDAQGTHRTATPGDEAAAAWLAREAQAIAGGAGSETFRVDRIDPVASFVEIDGRERIVGEPLFDGPPTTRDGVRGIAGAAEGQIAVLPLPPSVVYGPEFERLRRPSKHAAQVIVTLGGAPGLAPLNAEFFREPFGPPALQVSSVERDRLLAAVARQAELRVVVHFTRAPAEARNVVLTIPGRDRTRPPVVVMTPRSSWWVSTSERGGGIVCWLETLRALEAAPPVCDVIFSATSGHEIDHVGLDDFVARRPGWEKRATWIHYGASLGATGSRLTIQSNQDDFRALVVQHLTAAGHPPHALAPKMQVPTGETRDIHLAGGRYLTVGAPPASNALFHLPQDRWPDAVDVPAIARIAEGVAKTVVELTR